MRIQEGFDEGTGGAFAFGSGDADNWARAVVEKVFGKAGFVRKAERWDAGAAENNIIG